MTLSEDLNFSDQGGELDASPAYPVVFGITLTPMIIGILVGVLGLLGTGYIVLNMILPAWEIYQQQQGKQNDLQGQIEQKKASIKQIDQVKQDLELSKQQKLQILSLFANENTLDTLLIDVNRLVESSNAQLVPNAVRAKLKKFIPVPGKPEVITDGSLGIQMNGKLKRKNISTEIVGTYEQTQSILRNIERLQPLLIVKDYLSTLTPETASQPGSKVVLRVGPAPITTSFQLQALIPLSPEELAAAAKAEKPKK
ncbi:type II secretion system protein M [Aetokthonos hydrillicola Thurmond2011]|jgi:type IV pilus assembly protein PilO|uniref:Type II secretion system protein M n=1 Tax=Aetokthonos hydrillicola Thurmond2011 TaxID=2712845 RepID=A0AAP5I443_9CYAN|nr:pilus assembly protein PilO [Aetokthonos hydrillicola]MBW4588082.1 type II secretion system protein M [Aetokthonos hydrillicola CCALA 1050]MDR9893397.1 type II secretion system protein M [Aetokthonos hydrillicola Thurmond2011]